MASIQFMSQIKREYSVAIHDSRAGRYSARATQWVLSYHSHTILSAVKKLFVWYLDTSLIQLCYGRFFCISKLLPTVYKRRR